MGNDGVVEIAEVVIDSTAAGHSAGDVDVMLGGKGEVEVVVGGVEVNEFDIL